MKRKNKKPSAPRNYVALALSKRQAGSGAHIKSNKAKRAELKRKLKEEIDV